MIVSDHDKLKCVERELAMRRAVYPKRVAQKKMSQEKANRELEIMEAIETDYRLAIETGGFRE